METLFLFSDDIAAAILKVADEHRVTMIILGLSSKGMLTRLIEGDVARKSSASRTCRSFCSGRVDAAGLASQSVSDFNRVHGVHSRRIRWLRAKAGMVISKVPRRISSRSFKDEPSIASRHLKR